ncbi:MAG: GGDEF domain-containing protein [Gammaproteobacteria bacterium]|nr:GGDEF domain-containing protein [Gammaproteobacteria bacterium]
MAKEGHDLHPKAVGRLSLQSLTWLRDRQIPAQPIAYSVAFEYQHNLLQDLVKQVDYLENSNELNDDALDQLFLEFVLTKYIDFEGFNKSVTEIVEDTGTAVVEARNQLKEFRTFLKLANLKLEEITSKPQQELVSHLIQNTSVTYKSITTLENHLSTVMAEMRVLQKKYVRMQKQAQQDQLTGLLNRNSLQSAFQRLNSDEQVQEMSLVVADIDLFKRFNDEHGHTIGDKVIKLVADTLRSNLKGSDIISRYGGEEFVVILPNTKLKDASNLMNSIRQRIANLSFINKATEKKIDSITMSFGLSSLKPDDNFHSLFDRADKALYRSKQNGRNCVSCEQ